MLNTKTKTWETQLAVSINSEIFLLTLFDSKFDNVKIVISKQGWLIVCEMESMYNCTLNKFNLSDHLKKET